MSRLGWRLGAGREGAVEAGIRRVLGSGGSRADGNGCQPLRGKQRLRKSHWCRRPEGGVSPTGSSGGLWDGAVRNALPMPAGMRLGSRKGNFFFFLSPFHRELKYSRHVITDFLQPVKSPLGRQAAGAGKGDLPTPLGIPATSQLGSAPNRPLPPKPSSIVRRGGGGL